MHTGHHISNFVQRFGCTDEVIDDDRFIVLFNCIDAPDHIACGSVINNGRDQPIQNFISRDDE